MERRVVITGMGAVTPLGNTVESYWENLKNGVCGIDHITRFDPTDFKVKIAGEVKNFEPELYMEKKELKRNDLYTIYAIAASVQAFADSGINMEQEDAGRVGVMIGSGIGGLITLQDNITRLAQKGPNRVAPLFIPMAISNMAAGVVAIRLGAKGNCQNIVTACSSATHSIGDAFRNIKHGYLDVCVAGGAEASVCEIGIAGFANLTALSTNPDPKDACKPFDRDRDGFILGEGSGILVLEELEHAKARGAQIYAELAGFGATCDAYHMTSPDPEGTGAAAAIRAAMAEAGITAEQVGYINAHGTSTHANDSGETKAIKAALGEAAYRTPVSSTKSMTGHLLGAAGAIEAVACVKALQEGFLPPTINLKHPDEDCDLDYVANTGRPAEIEYVLSNSLGFGGHNGVLCFKKWR